MKRAEIFYLAAGAIGLAAALIGAVGTPHIEVANAPAAIVNGVSIPREALARAVLALQADSRNGVTPAREADVLERLIEEEVLVQHGVDLGLAETDFAARRALVQSVLALAVAERAGQEPSEGELRRFYRENAGFFAPAPRISASVVFFAAGAEPARIDAARAALSRGAPAQGLGDRSIIPAPHGALSEDEWRRLYGPNASNAVAHLQPGEVSAPAQVSGGVLVMRAEGFVASPAASFEAAAPQVRAEWDRRADEAAARSYIDRLKRRARIERRAPGSAR